MQMFSARLLFLLVLQETAFSGTHGACLLCCFGSGTGGIFCTTLLGLGLTLATFGITCPCFSLEIFLTLLSIYSFLFLTLFYFGFTLCFFFFLTLKDSCLIFRVRKKIFA